MKKLASWCVVCLCLMCLAAPAAAQEDMLHNGLAEFKLGGYYPAIDDAEFGGAGPFAEYFGSDWLWYVETEWDIYFYQGIGRAGIGLHVGYSSVTGNVRQAEEEEASAMSEDSLGETSFRVIPLRVSAVYRYDYSAIHHGIPLVPVAKIGLDYYLWRVTDASGATSDSGGVRGSGGRAGWHASLGMNLLLDFLDPQSAATFDLSWGVRNSYLFLEYMVTRIDGFGGTGLDLSDNLWMAGLAFEF